MTLELGKLEERLMDNMLQQDLSLKEKKQFDIINEKGSSSSVRSSTDVRNITEDLLKKESETLNVLNYQHAMQNPKLESVSNSESAQKNYVNQAKTADPVDDKKASLDDNEEHTGAASGFESDVEDNDSDLGIHIETLNVKQYDPSIDENLPETVKLLTTPDGGKLYLIGTAHFSAESQNDVSRIIQAVQPHIVMVELCNARVNILQLDEETILQEIQKLSFQYVRDVFQRSGFTNGLIYILLLNMSAHLTKQLGMAPGGEFRRALAEAKNVPNCMIHMGDRPVNITLQRALSSLSWWQTLKFAWILLTSKDPISKEEVEKYKRPDLLTEILSELTGSFPSIGEAFVKERDIYLTYSLQLACLPKRTPAGYIPARVVGVVGMGHVPGIVERWGTVLPSEIPPIMRIPPPSLSSKILRFGVKASLVGAVIYIGYKVIPFPSIGISQYFGQRS